MKLGIPKEIHKDERRVAATPDVVKKMAGLGHQILVEHDAGLAAGFPDESYVAVGATIVNDPVEIWGTSDMVIKVRAPELNRSLNREESDLLAEGASLICVFGPVQHPIEIGRLKARKATLIAMDLVPRISRAQKMDVLSSMANVAGYRAVIEAAEAYGRFFMGQITAAGKVEPSKVLVIGAGVAGLAAIGTAHAMGAIVRAFDARKEVKEQVKSMGAEFLALELAEDAAGHGGYAKALSEATLDAERKIFAEQCKEVDIIVTTALIPGQKPPLLITAAMVRSMKHGSVIVDMAAEQGGNCELTQAGKAVEFEGKTIIGYTDLPSRLSAQASRLFGMNVLHYLEDMHTPIGWKSVDDDEVLYASMVIRDGELRWPPPPRPGAPAVVKPPVPIPVAAVTVEPPPPEGTNWAFWITLAVGAALWLLVGAYATPEFLQHFTVFVLACLIGWKVIWDVKPSLHTPLMSVTNAISGIIILGGMLQLVKGASLPALILGALAILGATINIAGGFFVTHRMLSMFRK